MIRSGRARFVSAGGGNDENMRIKRSLFLVAAGFALAWFADPVSGPKRRRAVTTAIESRRWSDQDVSSGSGLFADAGSHGDPAGDTLQPPIMDDPELDIAVPSQRF
jgi:hypothetical protein